jgi:hypothetical protein
MKAIVVNCSSTPTHVCYNLGARKLTDWLKMQGYQVSYYDSDPGMWELDADLVCLSVIFSWHAPRAREIALKFGVVVLACLHLLTGGAKKPD